MDFIKKIICDLKKLFLGAPKGDTSSSEKNFRWDVFAPCNGKLIAKEDIKDQAFASGAMGEGVGIIPTDGSFCAFSDGKVSVAFHTKHAYVLENKDEPVSIMIHIGIDTVNLDPSKQFFITDRKVGDMVEHGDDLCTANLEGIASEGKHLDTALLVQNDNMEGKKVVFHKDFGSDIQKGDLIMSVVVAK